LQHGEILAELCGIACQRVEYDALSRCAVERISVNCTGRFQIACACRRYTIGHCIPNADRKFLGAGTRRSWKEYRPVIAASFRLTVSV